MATDGQPPTVPPIAPPTVPPVGAPAGRTGHRPGPFGTAMIPISFVLVLGAAVLLSVGLFGDDRRVFVWSSIGTAALAVLFLALAVLGRRGQGTPGAIAEVQAISWPLPAGEPPPSAAPIVDEPAVDTGWSATAGYAPTAIVSDRTLDPLPEDQLGEQPGQLPADPRDPADEPPIEAPISADTAAVNAMLAGPAAAGLAVAVVDGRPRYHLAACAFLEGKQAMAIPLGEAIESGFTPCALCRPVAGVAAARLHPPG
jgi:hypothetical protein